MPPGSAMPSRRTATFTPSPKMSAPSMMTSPTLMPIRKSILLSRGIPALRSAMPRWTSMAQRTASTTLLNSANIPSPVFLTTCPRCSLILGSTRTRRCSFNRTCVPSSSMLVSRLTSMDEEGTHVRLKEHLRVLVDPKISEHRGHVVKNTGDGMLAEFSSVVDAVRCAIDVQRGMAERNAGIPRDKRIDFRIGINVGDVIIDGADIFGDGVNVAVRLEGIAEPGGICVSARVQEYVQGQFEIPFEDVGEQWLKNIARPVRAYAIKIGAQASRAASSGMSAAPSVPRLSMVVLP